MHKRNTPQRRQHIVELVSQYGQISVQQLVQLTQASAVTIRKDLTMLADEGLLLRNFGGAQTLTNTAFLVVDDRVSESAALITGKQKIAKRAASLINDQSCILLDSGNTTAAMLPFLDNKQDVTLMTNCLQIAQAVSALAQAPNLLLTGGTWDTASQSLQGKLAEQSVQAYDFEQLFIGADSIDVDKGSTTFNELMQLSQLMARVAKQVVLLVEQKKVGRKMPNLELAWQDIDILITDCEFSPDDEQTIKQAGVSILYANE